MAFGQDFLNSFFGNDYLRDYTHASKTFRSAGYQNAPRVKFLFHVYFNLNTTQIPQLAQVFNATDPSTVGLLVKNITLPRYQVDVEVMNQYNRKRLVQKKINYQPVSVTFHDDGGDLIRNLWYNYYSYYYKDPTQAYRNQTNTNGSQGANQSRQAGFGYNSRDIYDGYRAVNDWGYVGEAYQDGTYATLGGSGKPAFFRDISIYGFDQHKFVEYVLINPMISEWQHDTYDYSQDAGVMENKVTIQYETVKYYSGAIGEIRSRAGPPVQGFGSPGNYDQTRSPLGRPGGTASIIGQGGLLDAGLGIISDLQTGSVAGVIGAVQKAGTAYGTFKNVKLADLAKTEVIQGTREVLRNDLPGAVRSQPAQNFLRAPVFPTPKR